MTLRPLFVTHLYEATLAGDKGFDAFNAELEDACRMIADEDRAGRAWAKQHGYAGYTSYASLDDLPMRATVFEDLKKKLDKHAAAFARDLMLDLDGKKLRLDSLWINILKPGGAHSGHIHPHSVLSGTIYISTPPGASALKLEDPRLAMMMAAPLREADAPQDRQPFVYIAPRAGTVLMWESWLRHEVPANAAKAERISVSFNYGWR
ncbi:TIGR02466 family protein [Caulobacter sp. NIBR2454]|uniref:TIGR02466 family protein n=1 Tax=Caulobacter sp. NIBR2454 TaxID=3015996 RepID=UPI0022B72DAF|nr:TIGR02466 family protein [Caulobacter sp. NIBR2454]